MSDGTKIEWTDATWNIINGCSVVSPGCTNCYAMKLAGTRFRNHPTRVGLTIDTKAGPVWNGQVRFNENMLEQPLRWAKPRMIFVCAHGDLFHEKVPDAWIDRVFAVMALASQHTFQVLTKRPERMRAYVSDAAFRMRVVLEIECLKPSRLWNGNQHQATVELATRGYLPNVWLGTSVEDQTRANERIPILLETPAAVRWLSMEPLLGQVYLWFAECEESGQILPYPMVGGAEPTSKLDWIVLGGESGPGARPMHPDWARSVRDQCAAAGVPFLFKQWGDWLPCEVDVPGDGTVVCYPIDGSERDMVEIKGSRPVDRTCGHEMSRVGKKIAGRLLDGVQHDGFPS